MPGNTVPRHVWVSFADRWAEAAPGLLLDWRQAVGESRRWEALTVWVDGGGDRRWHVHQDWVAAAHVRPLDAATPAPSPSAGSTVHTVPRHVWVCVTGRWHEAAPGLLVDWRRRVKRGSPWEALAISATGGGMRAWDLRQGWAEAGHVRPVVPATGRTAAAGVPTARVSGRVK